MKKLLLTCFLVIISILSYQQENSNKVEMSDMMRSNGKIYVVIAVILTIFAGLIFYLIRLDRKIKTVEKGVHE